LISLNGEWGAAGGGSMGEAGVCPVDPGREKPIFGKKRRTRKGMASIIPLTEGHKTSGKERQREGGIQLLSAGKTSEK